MAHQSENSRRLPIRTVKISRISDLPDSSPEKNTVHLFVLPFGRKISDTDSSANWIESLKDFSRKLSGESVVAILTSPQDAAETLANVGNALHFQLWIAVKLAQPVTQDSAQLPQHHASLLILSKYRSSLRHTKTRIAYTYCPACDKTTKDYGGKKHTYHQYGTLMSDVWRDITYSPGDAPIDIATRLADLFGLEDYAELAILDLTRLRSLLPKPIDSSTPNAIQSSPGSAVHSRLLNGDSLEELKKIPSGSIDFCYADPPYNLAKRYDSWDDAIDIQEYLRWCDRWIDELARVLRPGCTCAILNIPALAARHFQQMKRSLCFQSWIAWEGLSLPVRMIMPAHYATVCFSKGPARPLPGLVGRMGSQPNEATLTTLRENYCVRQSCVAMRRRAKEQDRERVTDLWWDIHRLKHNSRRVDHPCQLPPALMRRLIAMFTYKGEIVLDPFNGAGTSTLCAQALERRYIGIELSGKYHVLAESRHRLLQKGDDPFEKMNRVPLAKNSRVERIGGVRYEISKKALQLEVKRIASFLGHLPSRDELDRHGKYPIRYYDEYFISWGEVCAAARTTGMSETRNDGKSLTAIEQPTLFDSLA